MVAMIPLLTPLGLAKEVYKLFKLALTEDCWYQSGKSIP